MIQAKERASPVISIVELPQNVPHERQVDPVIENRDPIKLSKARTGNAFSLVEVRTPPGASNPFRSAHFEGKTYYVLDGNYIFRIGEESTELGPGDLAFVPRGTPHSYRNPDPLRAGMLVITTPGGIHARLLEATGEADEQTPLQKVAALQDAPNEYLSRLPASLSHEPVTSEDAEWQ